VSRPAWKFGLLTALTALACDVSFAAKPAPVKDFSRQVEVVVGGRLRETAKGQGELTLSLWNKSANAVAGPIFVVIDETGLEQVKVGSHSEETAKGKPVLEIVPAGRELLSGGMTPSFAVAFSMPAGLSRDVANTLHLEARVFGRQAPADAAKLAREKEAQEEADFATRGKNYNQAELTAAFAAQAAATPDLMKKPDVLATAVADDEKGTWRSRFTQ
jgi:hypothetical protein